MCWKHESVGGHVTFSPQPGAASVNIRGSPKTGSSAKQTRAAPLTGVCAQSALHSQYRKALGKNVGILADRLWESSKTKHDKEEQYLWHIKASPVIG